MILLFIIALICLGLVVAIVKDEDPERVGIYLGVICVVLAAGLIRACMLM